MTMFITCKSEYFNLKKRSTSMQFLKYTKVDRFQVFKNIYSWAKFYEFILFFFTVNISWALHYSFHLPRWQRIIWLIFLIYAKYMYMYVLQRTCTCSSATVATNHFIIFFIYAKNMYVLNIFHLLYLFLTERRQRK